MVAIFAAGNANTSCATSTGYIMRYGTYKPGCADWKQILSATRTEGLARRNAIAVIPFLEEYEPI